MAYIQLIYNPMAGQRFFPMYLDRFVEIFQNKGLEVRVYRTRSAEEFSTYLLGKDLTGCKGIFVAGGDGSVNRVVNAMMNQGIDLPLGVIPAGTANDFAMHLGFPQDQVEAIEMLAEMKVGQVDIGRANESYFVNVCCGGLFTNISQNIDVELKNTLGKLAYYIKGIGQLPKFNKIRFRIEHESGIIDDYFYLFLLLNGSSAGGFSKLGHDADIQDGVMDFVGIKACPIQEIPGLFGKILIGDHLNDKNIVFFKSNKMRIECLEGFEGFEETDIDGEAGPRFPLDIEVLHKQLKVLLPYGDKLH